MEETAMDYSLLKFSSGENKNNSVHLAGNKDRISIQKSTLFVILISVSVIIVGSEVFVYLMSSWNNNNCNFVIPEGYAIMANSMARTNSSNDIFSGKTLPQTVPEMTTRASTVTSTQLTTQQMTTSASTVTSNKLTTKRMTTRTSKVTSNKLTTRQTRDECANAEGATTVSANLTTGCPSNWLTYGQSCYFFSNQSFTWLDAMVRCQKLGGYLAEIDSAAENQFLKRHAKQIDNIECFPTTSIEYKGVRNTTYDGRVCQRWDSQKPHSHTRNNIRNFPEKRLADAANYCRDPDREGLPWCYTTDPDKRWQYCDIHKCPGGNWWVGMVILEGKWKWMNKQIELDKVYTNWGPAEPSKGNCGSFMGALDFAWNGENCNFPAMYICENRKISKIKEYLTA